MVTKTSKEKMDEIRAEAVRLGIEIRSNMGYNLIYSRVKAVKEGAPLASVNPMPRGAKASGAVKPKPEVNPFSPEALKTKTGHREDPLAPIGVMNQEIFRYQFAVIKTSLLFVDELYQRPENAVRVTKIASLYNPMLMTPLAVSTRKDGRYSLIDGQHRYLGALLRGIKELPCIVYTELDIPAEALLFKNLNTEKTALRPFDVFRASLQAGEEQAVSVDRAVQSVGFKVGNSSGSGKNSTHRRIGAVAALNSAWAAGGEKLIISTIKFLEHYANDGVTIQSWMIAGMSNFLARNRFGKEDSTIDWDHFSNAMRATPHTDFLRIYKQVTHERASATAGSNGAAVVGLMAIAEIYNRNAPRGKKIKTSSAA